MATGVDLMKTTLTLSNSQVNVICSDPIYSPRSGSCSHADFVPSCIVTLPGSDQGFCEICYIKLRSGWRPVVVTRQKDGQVRLAGAYIDSIAGELELLLPNHSPEVSPKDKAWMSAMDDGWPDHEIPPETKVPIVAFRSRDAVVGRGDYGIDVRTPLSMIPAAMA